MKLFAIRNPEEPFVAVINFEHEHSYEFPEIGHYWAVILNLGFARIYYGFSYYNVYDKEKHWKYGSYSPIIKLKLFK